MKDLTKGSPGKLVVQFGLPILIGNIFQLFYSLADIRIVGSTLGDQALAAVGATSTLNNLIIGFLIGLTNGFAVLMARDFGAQKMDHLRKDLGSALKLGIMISILLTFFSVVLLKPILMLLNMPEELMVEGTAYIRVILLGMTAAMLYNICASVLRAMGDTVTPLMFLIFSTLMNIGLDYFFILVLHTGVAGAAYATVISQIVATVLCWIYIRKRYPVLHLQKSDFVSDNKLYKALLASGLSMGLMQSLVSLGTVALQGAINTLGTDIIVAHTAARKITEIFMLPFGVLGMTMATYSGQNLGAGQIRRIKIGLKQVTLVAFVWCCGVLIASYTIAPMLIRLVTATNTPVVIETAALYLKIDTLLYFVPAVISILRNTLQGIGDHVTPIVSSFIELVGKILVAICLTPYLKYMGIILAEPIVWVLMIIPLIIRIYTIPQLKEENLPESISIH